MGQRTLTMNEAVIQKMKTYYNKTLDNTPQGAIFRARTDSAVITAYKSGKVLFQGSHAEEEASKWKTNASNANTSFRQVNASKKPSYYPPPSLFTANHIGSDESGTDDYFGLLTTNDN